MSFTEKLDTGASVAEREFQFEQYLRQLEQMDPQVARAEIAALAMLEVSPIDIELKAKQWVQDATAALDRYRDGKSLYFLAKFSFRGADRDYQRLAHGHFRAETGMVGDIDEPQEFRHNLGSIGLVGSADFSDGELTTVHYLAYRESESVVLA